VRDGETLNLSDCDTADVAAVCAALAVWLPVGGPLDGEKDPMLVNPGNATALVVALADLAARDDELDLIDCDRADIAAVYAVLARWLQGGPDRRSPPAA
jgi:hypothetical protein